MEIIGIVLAILIPFSHGRAVAKAAGGRGRFFLLPEETHDTVFLEQIIKHRR